MEDRGILQTQVWCLRLRTSWHVGSRRSGEGRSAATFLQTALGLRLRRWLHAGAEHGFGSQEPERSAASSPPAGWHETRARGQKEAADDDTNSSDAVKTDHEILSVALRDIDLINSALSTEAPSTELKNGRNVMAAYRDFMKKGRKLGEMRRPWEDKPDDKVSIYNATASARYH